MFLHRGREGQTAVITGKPGDDPDEMVEREWIEILLPEDFVTLQASQTIQLKFKGKCKIEKILFKKKQ